MMRISIGLGATSLLVAFCHSAVAQPAPKGDRYRCYTVERIGGDDQVSGAVKLRRSVRTWHWDHSESAAAMQSSRARWKSRRQQVAALCLLRRWKLELRRSAYQPRTNFNRSPHRSNSRALKFYAYLPPRRYNPKRTARWES